MGFLWHGRARPSGGGPFRVGVAPAPAAEPVLAARQRRPTLLGYAVAAATPKISNILGWVYLCRSVSICGLQYFSTWTSRRRRVTLSGWWKSAKRRKRP